MRRTRGHVLLVVLILALVIMMGGFFAVKKLIFNSANNMRQKKNTFAMELAQGGINTGYHWLKENPSRWYDIITTPVTLPPSDFTGVTAGSELTVTLSYVSDSKRRILSVAKVKSSTGTAEVRALEAILSVNNNPASLWTNETASIGGTVEFHWGPIFSNEDIRLSGASATKGFPRKFSRGRIFQGNTEILVADMEFFPNQVDMPDIPPVDLKYYEDQAAAQFDGQNPVQGTRGPGNNNVYTAANNGYVAFNNLSDPQPNDPNTSFLSAGNDDRVRFIKGNLRLQGNTYIRGSLIVLGDVKLAGTGNGRYLTPVPVKAWQEYRRIDTGVASEYPSDGGSSSNATFKFGDTTNPPLSVGTKDCVSINGFIYVTGTLTGVGDQVVHGAAWVNPQGSGTQGRFTVYYRDDLTVHTSQVSPTFAIEVIRPAVTP